MTRVGAPFRWISAWLVSVAGCATPLEAPSAYAGERFLCGSEHAAEFQELSAACREAYLGDRSCEGYASLKGESDGQPFVVDAPLFGTYYAFGATGPAYALTVSADGLSPYFSFRLQLYGLTREVTESGVIVCQTVEARLFGIEVRGASDQQAMNLNTCEIERLMDGVYVSFSARLARGGNIDACAYVIDKAAAR